MLIKEVKKDGLPVEIYDSREEMGAAAGRMAVEAIRALLKTQKEVNVIFPAAPSQNEILAYVVSSDLDFGRINAFHMDEYIGLTQGAPQRFSSYLVARVFSKVTFKSVHYLGMLEDAAEECARYARLLEQFPVDVALIGIGENGHIAFNDPPVANFEDPVTIKVVELDERCRMQQVHDGCFPSLDAVPKTAYTLTIPALLRAKHVICTVPGPTKAQAVESTVLGDVSIDCPASILRRYNHCTLFCDAQSAAALLADK